MTEHEITALMQSTGLSRQEVLASLPSAQLMALMDPDDVQKALDFLNIAKGKNGHEFLMALLLFVRDCRNNSHT